MTNVNPTTENGDAIPLSRRPFVAPAVEDLGHLQALTQLQGVTF